jgi:hypothetical protein
MRDTLTNDDGGKPERPENDYFYGPYPAHPALDEDQLLERFLFLNDLIATGIDKAIETFNAHESVNEGGFPPVFPEEIFSALVCNVLGIIGEDDEAKVEAFAKYLRRNLLPKRKA